MLADVAYVDMLEGDTECHVRFNTPEDAQTVMKSHKDLQIKNNWKYEILTGKSCCLFVVFCGLFITVFFNSGRRQFKYICFTASETDYSSYPLCIPCSIAVAL